MTALCQCGCGRPAPIARRTNRKYGHVKGEPVRFLTGHCGRVRDYGIDFAARYVVDPETGCWDWQHTRTPAGYGIVHHRGRRIVAHRFFYERTHGPVPDGLVLDHLCRNRACCNPDHVEPVTNAENVRRGARVKVTHAIVAEIRAAVGTHKEVAERFGISKTSARQIRNGQRWAVA